jgi:hypothetical protein
MTNTSSLRGLTTIGFWATDVEAAKEWRAQLLGVEPYFVRPPAPAPVAYIEFRIGGDQHQLGIMAARSCARNNTAPEQPGRGSATGTAPLQAT